jgi:ketosteroid isomerase-like protein
VILPGRMSRENADLALLMNQAFNSRDLNRFLALMHDEVEIEPRVGALEGDYQGHPGVRRWWSDLLDFLPDYAAEVEELDELGDMTLGRIRGTAHGAASSTPVVETWWQLIRWRDGKCIWWRNFAIEAEALAAVTLEAR